MAVQSFNVDEELAAAERSLREHQDTALRDRRAGEATLNPVAGSALQGATFGFGDEGTAAIRSLFGSTPYDIALKQERAGMEKFRDEHPVADLALNVGGSIIPTLAGGRIIRGMRGEPTPPPPAAGGPPPLNPLGFGGPRLTAPPPSPYVPPVPALPTVGPTIANAVKLGAAQGALQGFGEGEGGLGNRLAGGAFGGVFGGGVGGVVGGLTHGAAQVLASPLLASRRAFSDAAALKSAQDKIVQNATRSGTDLEGLETRLADLQSGRADLTGARFPESDLTLGERLGASVTPAMDAAAQMPGKGSTLLREQLTERAAGRGGRVSEGLRAVFGDLEDDYTQRLRLRQERSADAGPLFQTAWDNARPVEAIDLANLRHVPQEVFADARKLARMEGRDVAFEPRFDDDGFMLPLRDGQVPPGVEDMHRVKSALTDYVNAHTDPTGAMDALGNRARNVRDALKARLDELTTDEQGVSHYRRATDAWAEPSAEMAASKLGKGAANMNGSELQHRISLMSEPERQAFAAGFFGDLRERLSKVDLTGNANPVRAVFRDEKQRNAVNTALAALGIGADEADRRMTLLTRFFGDEISGAKTETSILRNSATAQRQAWMRDLAVPTVGGTLIGGGSLARGDDPTTAFLTGLGAAGAGKLSSMGRQAYVARGTENMNNAMLALLGTTDPAAQSAAMRALRERAVTAAGAGGGASRFAGGVSGQMAGPRIGGGLGLPAGLTGLMSPPAPINDPRFQPQ